MQRKELTNFTNGDHSELTKNEYGEICNKI